MPKVLDALSRQDGWHMRMQQLARATGLAASATTRLVNRLERRELLARVFCADDRRGIYTELTPAGGGELLAQARPTQAAVLEAMLTQAGRVPELAPLVAALATLGREAAGVPGTVFHNHTEYGSASVRGELENEHAGGATRP